MRLRLVALVVASQAVAGCHRPAPAPAPADGPPAAGGTVVIGLLSDVQSWNPYLSEDEDTEQILQLLYPTLAIEQTDYRLHPPSFEPHLAESWSWSDDHLELTFKLADEAVWSDGVPVTADDVVFTFKAQISPELGWPFADAKDRIAEVVAVDRKTVRFRFTARYPYQLMDANDGPIVPAHRWRDLPFASWREIDWSRHLVAAGPFRLASHVPQQSIVLERFDGYWKPRLPHLDRAVFRIVPSRTSQLAQLLSGELDLIDSVPPADAERVRRHPGLTLVVFPDRGYTQVRWNLRRPVFADRRVRTALAMAVDRDVLIDAVFDGYARPASGPILSDMWAFNRNLEPLRFDPAAAVRLLADAGWVDRDGDGILDRDGSPLAFELLVNSESERRQDTALLIEEYLERIGVRAELRVTEWGTLLAAERRGQFDAIVGRWIEPTVIDLGQVWRTAGAGEPTLNSIGYSNPEVDRLLDEVAGTLDFAAQKPLFDRIQELIVADQPYAFLVETMRLVGVATRIRGADINDASPLFNIDEWYVNVAGGG